MKKKDIIRVIEETCPSSLQEDWDNCGLQVDAGPVEIRRILVSLEASAEVLREAEEKGAQMLVTHHPLLFRGLKTIAPDDPEGGLAMQMIQSGITQYACHTSFDKLEGGNNDDLGQRLGIQNIRMLGEPDGICRRGELPRPSSFRDFIRAVSEALQIEEKFLHACGNPDAVVRSAAWCTGSGAEFIRFAKERGCDLFITGDLKYHDAQAAKFLNICVLDAGHYGTEKIFTSNMAAKLREKLQETECEILESEVDLNPFIC